MLRDVSAVALGDRVVRQPLRAVGVSDAAQRAQPPASGRAVLRTECGKDSACKRVGTCSIMDPPQAVCTSPVHTHRGPAQLAAMHASSMSRRLLAHVAAQVAGVDRGVTAALGRTGVVALAAVAALNMRHQRAVLGSFVVAARVHALEWPGARVRALVSSQVREVRAGVAAAGVVAYGLCTHGP